MKAICCDTTPSNLGHENGAAAIIERILNENYLYLPCRHHIFEVVLGGVFDTVMPPSTGPEIRLFKRFESEWENFDKKNYKTGLESKRIVDVLINDTENINHFVQTILDGEAQPRDDYRELLLLSLVFIGKIPPEKVKFYKPGAVSRARFMAKANILSINFFIPRTI